VKTGGLIEVQVHYFYGMFMEWWLEKQMSQTYKISRNFFGSKSDAR
jgi:hypothetical protein